MTLGNFRFALVASVVVACGGIPSLDGGDTADETNDPYATSNEALTAVATPIHMISKQWWGDVATPLNNQLWADVADATPGRNFDGGTFTYHWSCALPQFPNATQTLRLTQTRLETIGDATAGGAPSGALIGQVTNPVPGQVYSATVNFSSMDPQWIEIRIRCQAVDTAGIDDGKKQFVSAAFQVQVKGGTATNSGHATPGYGVHNHSWYDQGVGYIYPYILNVPDLLSGPLSGVMTLNLKASFTGETTPAHFMVKIDDQVATMTNGQKAEFMGSGVVTSMKPSFDTRLYANGQHKVAFHVHGLSTNYRPGEQLASQVEIFPTFKN